MTITLVLGQSRVEVDNSRLQTSELVKGVISDLQQTNIDIIIPPEYWPVVDIYLDFINKISYNEKGKVLYTHSFLVISNIDILLLCFFMEAFFEDNAFFVYLMQQAYGIWDKFYPDIKLLPDERLIYLYTPYEFVPEKYIDKESFFREWLSINANEDITLNGNRVYHTDVKYYPNEQAEELEVYLTIDRIKVGPSHKEAWYENGQPKYRYNFKDGKSDGLQEVWYENGQPKYRGDYKDDKRSGLQEEWYTNGQSQRRHNYKDDKPDGLQEGWYENGQDKYRGNFKDGKQDGLWERWYENGQLQSQQLYKMDKFI